MGHGLDDCGWSIGWQAAAVRAVEAPAARRAAPVGGACRARCGSRTHRHGAHGKGSRGVRRVRGEPGRVVHRQRHLPPADVGTARTGVDAAPGSLRDLPADRGDLYAALPARARPRGARAPARFRLERRRAGNTAIAHVDPGAEGGDRPARHRGRAGASFPGSAPCIARSARWSCHS